MICSISKTCLLHPRTPSLAVLARSVSPRTVYRGSAAGPRPGAALARRRPGGAGADGAQSRRVRGNVQTIGGKGLVWSLTRFF